MVLFCFDKTVPLHFPEFFGKSASLQIEVIGQLLTVKRYVEFIAVLLKGYRIQIRQYSSAYGLRRGMETSA